MHLHQRQTRIIFHNIVSGENVISKDHSSEAAAQVKEKLCDISQILQHNSKTYELRGLSFKAGKTKLRNSIGHYCAFAKRGTSNWEQFDDMKKKPIPIKDTKVVNFFYQKLVRH